MFTHNRVSNYQCNSCGEIKSDEILLHVPGIAINLLVVVCIECIDTLRDDCLDPNRPQPSSIKLLSNYKDSLMLQQEKLQKSYFNQWRETLDDH